MTRPGPRKGRTRKSAPTGVEAMKRMALLADADGRRPLPFPRVGDGKGPRGSGWQGTTRAQAREAIKRINGNTNLGVLLGEPSAGLVDVDLDCPEARALAPVLLPATPARHGRASLREAGHWWYVATDAERTLKYADPTSRATLVELRSTGGQTVIPPSVYPDDTLGWKSTGAPARVGWADLRRAVAHLAAATLLARHYPAEGARHDASLALAGVLAHLGEKRAAEILRAVARVAGDGEWRQRASAARTTLRRIARDEPVQRVPALKRSYPPAVVDRVCEWLDVPDMAELAGENAPTSAASKPTTDPPLPRTASTIQTETVEWLLPGWLLKDRGVHLLGGRQGDGKSYVLAALAAYLTRGKAVPGMGTPPKCRVLYLASEDDAPSILRPRLEQAGADLRYVEIVDQAFDAAEQLEAVVGGVRTKFKRSRRPLVVILDALDSFLLLEDANANAEVRARLELLRGITERQRVTLIGVKHKTKSDRGAEDIYAISGASAYTEVARCVWLLARDELRSTAEETRVVLEVRKNNYAAIRQGVEFSVTAEGVAFHGDTGRRLSDLRDEQSPRGRGKAKRREFFSRVMGQGGQERTRTRKQLLRMGHECGVETGTIDAWLAEAVERGWLKRVGRKGSGRYRTTPAILQAAAEPVEGA